MQYWCFSCFGLYSVLGFLVGGFCCLVVCWWARLWGLWIWWGNVGKLLVLDFCLTLLWCGWLRVWVCVLWFLCGFIGISTCNNVLIYYMFYFVITSMVICTLGLLLSVRMEELLLRCTRRWFYFWF